MAQEFLQAFALVGIVLFLFGSLVFIVLTAVFKFYKKNKPYKKNHDVNRY